ncbi:MAG: CBS domain-containing protein [Clostridia bacterium]
MFVIDSMTKNPISVEKNATISAAFDLMRNNNIKRLTVTDSGKLIGLVTLSDLERVSPSQATSLSMYELNYLLDKITVGEAIPKKQQLITITPTAFLEEAALLMNEQKISTLPVVEQGALVGIITEKDIFDAFLDLFGTKSKGTRITIAIDEDHPGIMAAICNLLAELQVNIRRIAVSTDSQGETYVIILIDKENDQEAANLLQAQGYKIHSVKCFTHK